MKIVYNLIGMLFGVAGLYVVIIYAASELGGEVVTLIKPTSESESSSVRVWVVDKGDQAWIEHGSRGDFWLEKLADQPELKMIRQGKTGYYRAVIDAPAHDLYHHLRN